MLTVATAATVSSAGELLALGVAGLGLVVALGSLVVAYGARRTCDEQQPPTTGQEPR